MPAFAPPDKPLEDARFVPELSGLEEPDPLELDALELEDDCAVADVSRREDEEVMSAILEVDVWKEDSEAIESLEIESEDEEDATELEEAEEDAAEDIEDAKLEAKLVEEELDDCCTEAELDCIVTAAGGDKDTDVPLLKMRTSLLRVFERTSGIDSYNIDKEQLIDCILY